MARPTDGLSGVRWASGDGPVRTPAPTGLGHRTWFMKMFAGAHNVYLSFPSTARAPTEGARNVHPYKRYTEAFRLTRDGAPRPSLPTEIYITTALLASTAAFAAPGQRSNLQASGASHGEGGRAAAAVYHKAIDGRMLSRYHPLSKNNRRRVGSAKVGRAPVCRGGMRPGVLRG